MHTLEHMNLAGNNFYCLYEGDWVDNGFIPFQSKDKAIQYCTDNNIEFTYLESRITND